MNHYYISSPDIPSRPLILSRNYLLLLIILLLSLTSCRRAELRSADSLTEDEKSVIYAVLSQLPNESATRPYVTVSDLSLPQVMFDSGYVSFSQELRQDAKNRALTIESAAADFLKWNQPAGSFPVRNVAHPEIIWVTSEELTGLLSTDPNGARMKWFRLKDKLGDVPRFFRVSRPGIDRSNGTAIIYASVHYPVGPASGRLYVLRRNLSSWIIDPNEYLGPAWAY